MDLISLTVIFGAKFVAGKFVAGAIGKTAMGGILKTVTVCGAKTAVGAGGKAALLKSGAAMYAQQRVVEAAVTEIFNRDDVLGTDAQSCANAMTKKVEAELVDEVLKEARSGAFSAAFELLLSRKMSTMYDTADYTYDTAKYIDAIKEVADKYDG